MAYYKDINGAALTAATQGATMHWEQLSPNRYFLGTPGEPGALTCVWCSTMRYGKSDLVGWMVFETVKGRGWVERTSHYPTAFDAIVAHNPTAFDEFNG